MLEFLNLLKQNWFLVSFIAGLVVAGFWLKLDSRYSKKSDIGELRLSISRIEKNMQALETNSQRTKEMLTLLLEKEVRK